MTTVVHENYESWKSALEQAPNSYRADDPKIEGPWHNPTRGALLGFVNPDSDTYHIIDIRIAWASQNPKS